MSSYELMQQCWSLNPDDRPTPVDIVAKLTPLDVAIHEEHISIPEEPEKDCKSNGTMENGTNHLGKEIYILSIDSIFTVYICSYSVLTPLFFPS